ncbi:neuroglian-like [Gigantopelta aegis]|uniref:neuroglian-like n=1 Tax=Gigantopelta aegis TaxID=1735272 RepID=UPI001B88E6F4|nr:neuroglian-like [Gigantopelta aegis]
MLGPSDSKENGINIEKAESCLLCSYPSLGAGKSARFDIPHRSSLLNISENLILRTHRMTMKMSRSALLVLFGIFGIASSVSRKTKLPPSVFVDTDQPVYFIPGELVTLKCAATGEPQPQISWLIDGEPFDFTTQSATNSVTISDSGSLTFHSITKENQGKYQCQAANVRGVSLSSEIVVKEAFLESFQDKEHDETITVPLGYAIRLPCLPPESQPDGKVVWTKILDDGSKKTIQNNLMGNDLEISDRMTSDYEGNLYILSTRPEDSDGWFSCTVTNEFLQSTITGPKKMLSISGEYPVLKPTELLWKSPKIVQAVMYEVVKLKCIMGGNPIPRVSWTHNNADISSTGGYEISENTFELSILEFQETEIGRYQCIGNNEMGDDVVGTFHVSAVQKPYWISKPQDVTVAVDEDVTLRCKATGIPDPVVSWFINGKPLEESDVLNKNARFLDDSLVFKNVDMHDSTVIQCNASNPFGFVWADFYLNVLAEVPVIEGRAEPVVKILRGGTVSLPCRASGNPKPVRRWFKGDQIIKPGRRYKISADGDLQFDDVGIVDGGSYSCVVSNKFGKDERQVSVVIQEMTRIIVPPVNKFVTSGDDVSFHCEAVTDYREQANLIITWLKNNETIETESDVYRGRLAITHDALVLHDVVVGDRGMYTCVATSSIDSAKATAQLKVKGPPDAPYDIQIIHCTPGRADIGWKFDKSLENFSPVKNFSVQYSTHHRPGHWVLAAEAPHHRKQAAMRLAPWTEYTFRVAAVSKLGRGKYSAPSQGKCRTPMSRPFRNPRRIRKIANKTGFLVLEWAAIPRSEHNGEGFYYNITIKEDGTKTYTSHIINSYNMTRIEIPVSTVFRPYSIMVSSGNTLGPSLKAPRITKGYSGEAVPLAIPENFELDPSYPVTNTSVRVQWDRVNSSLAVIRGAFKGYQLTYWKTEDPDSKKGIRIPPNRAKPKKVKHTLHDLPPYTNISMDVAVINSYFISNHSPVINFTTPEGVPGKVQYLFIQSRGSRYFLLEWKEPENKNGDLLGYQIGYKKQPFSSAMTIALSFDTPNISRAFLSGLEPETLYKVAIWGFSKQGNGEAYYMTALTMEDNLPLAEPRVTKVVAGKRSFTIQWELDESVDARAASTYYIKYRRVGCGAERPLYFNFHQERTLEWMCQCCLL